MTTARMPSGTFARRTGSPTRRLVPRHSTLVRITHWINVFCFSLLLMTGAQIFNAHPRLYWGEYGADNDHAWLSVDSLQGGAGYRGVVHLGSLTLETTGLLGASKEDGNLAARGFPSWLTIPSYQDLAAGRRWHFFFAWLFAITQTPEERHAITRKLGAFKTSMLQDAEAGRAIELDSLVGSVRELGRHVGVETPLIDAIFGLARVFGQVHGLYPQPSSAPLV